MTTSRNLPNRAAPTTSRPAAAAANAAERTRPLCPYPQHAVYTGSGSTDDEKNFVCK
jgi:feruloyl esterase